MPLERDWLAARIETITQAIAAMLGLKKKGDVQAAIAEAEGSITKAFGINGKLALGLALNDFLMFACRAEKPTARLLQKLAELFTEWASVLEAAGRGQEAAMARARAQECVEFGKTL